MNTDYTKPSLAPKPRFVCHARLKLPSPLTSAARGPKPFIAPKPKITLQLNGNQGEFSNGCAITSDEEVDEDHELQNGQNRGIIDISPAEKQFNASICKSPRKNLQPVSKKQLNREVTEGENKEQEEDAFQKMDDDWRLTDSALTEETDSLETLWVSDVRLGGDSVEVEELTDTDVTEDMDAEGCDAGEALADTDGLSVGNISVNSTDEDARCYSADSCEVNQEKLQIKEDGSTADELSESLTDKPDLLVKDSRTDTDAEHAFLMEEKTEDSGPDCGFTSNILNCGHKIKEKSEKWRDICFYNFIPGSEEEVCETTRNHAALEGQRAHEPLYICSEDIINQGLRPESTLSVSSFHPMNKSGLLGRKIEKREENVHIDYLDVVDEHGNDSGHKNEEDKADEQEDELNHLDCQLRFRQVAISLPADMDTSLTSSLSENQLLSPNDSDVFRDEDDPDSHIVPFLDETTDTEQDISDEHVYEEPRQSSQAKNVFPLDRKTPGIQSHSLSHRITNNLDDMGVQFVQKTYMSGFGQPALSSSPMLSSTRHKSYSKPHYLSLYPRSLSMEGKDTPMCLYRDGSQRHRDAVYSPGSFSRGSPLSSSALSTPTSLVDIPPPFELAYITKKPITKSSPSLLTGGDLSEKNKKKKSSLKRFLMLKFGRKTESKPVDVKSSSSKSSAEFSHRTPSRLLDLDRHSTSSSPRLNSRSASRPQVSQEPASTFLFYEESKRKGNTVAFLNRSVVRVESFEDRSRVPFIPLPLTKPRSISFPNTDTSDYENVPAISSDYENVQVPQRRPVRQVPRKNFFDRPGRVLSVANETDGYVDMSSLPGFEHKTQSPEQETERTSMH